VHEGTKGGRKEKKGESSLEKKVEGGSVLEGVLQCVAVCCSVRKKSEKGQSSLGKTVKSR